LRGAARGLHAELPKKNFSSDGHFDPPFSFMAMKGNEQTEQNATMNQRPKTQKKPKSKNRISGHVLRGSAAALFVYIRRCRPLLGNQSAEKLKDFSSVEWRRLRCG
jgi:hypothetical protein